MHDLSWYVKWVSVVFVIVGWMLTSVNLFPWSVIFQMTGVAGWLWVGYPRHDRALIVLNAIGVQVVRVGTIKILGRNVMSKEVDIIKKAMADNKKVFLKRNETTER